MRATHIAILLLAILAPACFLAGAPRAFSNQRVGVTTGQDGDDVEVFVALCPGEAVRVVELYAATGSFLGDDDDRLVWRVEAATPVTADTFSVVLGTPPSAFDETLPLRADAITQMTGDVNPGVILTLTGGPGIEAANISFESDDVPTEGYLNAAGDVVPREGIEAGLEDLCPAESPS